MSVEFENLDRYGRKIDYMRISVTNRCNLRCSYCNSKNAELSLKRKPLSNEEFALIAEAAASLGIVRFRITGGEPLVKEDCPELVALLKGIPGVKEVTLTTNGVLLSQYLSALKQAGLDGINISLDTTDRNLYKTITGSDALDPVMEAIDLAARDFPVKINCVAMKGLNEDTAADLVLLAKDRPVDVRFIELMPIGPGRNGTAVPGAEILKQLEAIYGKSEEDRSRHGSGPAVYRRFKDFRGSVGFISPVSEKFCAACTRLRLGSEGDLRPCLCYPDVIPLRGILREDLPEKKERLCDAIREAIRSKPAGHCFDKGEALCGLRAMADIGG